MNLDLNQQSDSSGHSCCKPQFFPLRKLIFKSCQVHRTIDPGFGFKLHYCNLGLLWPSMKKLAILVVMNNNRHKPWCSNLLYKARASNCNLFAFLQKILEKLLSKKEKEKISEICYLRLSRFVFSVSVIFFVLSWTASPLPSLIMSFPFEVILYVCVCVCTRARVCVIVVV